MNALRTTLAMSFAALVSACANPGATMTAPASAGTSHAGMSHGDAATANAPASSDARMQAMQAMHQKMMDAKTPAERQALMADHMKAMQGGMGMMKDMQAMQAMHAAGGMGPMGSSNAASPMAGMGEGKGMPDEMARRHQMMTEHMAMMQMMMDMMADRMPPAAMGK